MTHDPQTGTAPQPGSEPAAYRTALITALRLKDVPPDRIGELVAEVESHVADTGEDPVDAFGPAREYAAGLTSEHRPPPWWHTALTVGCALLAGWLVGQGMMSLLLGDDYLGMPGWVWLALGLAVAVPAAVRVRQRSALVRDPRTGAAMTPMPWWSLAVLAAVPVGIVLVAYAAIQVFSG